MSDPMRRYVRWKTRLARDERGWYCVAEMYRSSYPHGVGTKDLLPPRMQAKYGAEVMFERADSSRLRADA